MVVSNFRLKRRVLAITPELDREGMAEDTGQRCRLCNPPSQHAKVKRALQEIWMAETKKVALAGFDAFRLKPGASNTKADQGSDSLISPFFPANIGSIFVTSWSVAE
jgi:hypothetical protein